MNKIYHCWYFNIIIRKTFSLQTNFKYFQQLCNIKTFTVSSKAYGTTGAILPRFVHLVLTEATRWRCTISRDFDTNPNSVRSVPKQLEKGRDEFSRLCSKQRAGTALKCSFYYRSGWRLRRPMGVSYIETTPTQFSCLLGFDGKMFAIGNFEWRL